MLDDCSLKKSITNRELLSLLGHLKYESRVIVLGRSFVSYLLGLIPTVKELHHHIRLGKDCIRDIAMRTNFFDRWNGVSFFYDDNVTESADFELFTDSSGFHGYGGYFQGLWFSEPWPTDLSNLSDEMSIAFLDCN